jgi:predicted secreted protein
VTIKTNVNTVYTHFHDWYAANFHIGNPNGIGYNYSANDVSTASDLSCRRTWLTFPSRQVVGIHGYSASRLIPTSYFSSDAQRPLLDNLTDLFVSLPLGGRGFLVGGGAVATGSVASSAANPAWRTALVDVTIGAAYVDGSSVEVAEQTAEAVHQWSLEMEALTPGSGTYLNEYDNLQENFTEAFWGSNYPRLKAVKKAWDPTDLFMTVLAVGAEDWDETVTCRLN